VDSGKLPPESNWPAPTWPDQVFGWLLQLGYDGHGNLIPSRTTCINEKLMDDDYGKDPPTIG
jgi:hypothetical protein